uniref:Uncharacterized protein n=1 Tax=Anguilla anguilla TaxID=7936 RepID=A0A0E9RGT9_ANGAN
MAASGKIGRRADIIKVRLLPPLQPPLCTLR